MSDKYHIELEGKGCDKCNQGEYWTIVDDDDVAIGESFADKEFTQDICDLMNMAYDAGQESMWKVERALE